MSKASGIALAPAVSAASAFLLSTSIAAADPFYEGQVLEFSLGAMAPLNSLQDALTVPNGGGPTVQSTDILDLGQGGRGSIAYSRPWGDNSRFVFELSASSASETTALRFPSVQTYPGSYDDGFSIGFLGLNDGTFQVETEIGHASVGREWALPGSWAFGAGLEFWNASQDARIVSLLGSGMTYNRLVTQSENRMLGVYVGGSHYVSFGPDLGLRVMGQVGVLNNDYDYGYSHRDGAGNLQQSIDASGNSVAYSTTLAVRLEQEVSDDVTVTLEAGYEGLHGVISGVNTFLDRDGTATVPSFGRDSIEDGYLAVGIGLRF